jgi:hypothetical protein
LATQSSNEVPGRDRAGDEVWSEQPTLRIARHYHSVIASVTNEWVISPQPRDLTCIASPIMIF